MIDNTVTCLGLFEVFHTITIEFRAGILFIIWALEKIPPNAGNYNILVQCH